MKNRFMSSSLHNHSGKVLTFFTIIIVVLLLTLSAASVFYLQKEQQERISVQKQLEAKTIEIASFQKEIQDLKKQTFLLQEKNNDADEKINGLLDDIELEKGIREELKVENNSLKEQLAKEKGEKETFKAQATSGYQEALSRIADLEDKLRAQEAEKTALLKQIEGLHQRNTSLIDYSKQVEEGSGLSSQTAAEAQQKTADELTNAKKAIDLEKIVVAPEKMPDGRVISVDTQTEFVIINLGEKDGLGQGTIMAVYRGQDYLGDIKVTRVQSEMSAADLIPPFSSRLVRKNDQVVLKQ